ncbi:MAG: alpha-galactosidase [Clostridia bacterium]|nr:alpha-galactosidase [Clostridia bacterium]
MIQNSSTYVNVFTRNMPEPVYSYRSGLTVYEERFLEGMLIPGGWNASGYPLNVLSNYPTFVSRSSDPSVFHVAIDGESVDYRLSVKDFAVIEKENGAKETVLTLTSDFKPVEIVVHTLLDGTAMFVRWLEIRNLSDKPMAVSRLSVFCGVVETVREIRQYGTHTVPEGMYELGYFENAAWGNEGDMVWKNLPYDKTSFAGRFNRHRFRHPAFFLKNKVTGMLFFGQMAYSGAYEFSFDYMANRNSSDVSMNIDMAVDGVQPLYLIDAGAVFVSPQVHIGAIFGTLDDAVNISYDHIRRSVLNMPEASGEACYVVSGMGAEHDMTVETTKRFMEQMAEVGAEVFIVDAGWYCPPGKEGEWYPCAGDWHPDPERYPNGIREIRDHAKKLGLKFGMWMEAERLGDFSESYKAHPEWSTFDMGGNSSCGLLDFTNTEAAAWAESEIARIITENELDLFRIDYNNATVTSHFVKNGERQEYTLLKHYEGVCAMYERLKKRFPNVLFENCAGGGGRTDLGLLRSMNHTWVSDWQKAPRSLYITMGMTLVLPPERVDRLVGGMGCHAFASLDFQMRNVMLGHITLNVFSPAAAEYNPEQLAFIRHSVDIYKNFIRTFLPDSHMYHHNESIPTAEKEGFCALELVAADKTKAAMTIFSLPGAESRCINVVPKGLDTGKTYRVTFDNTGAVTAMTGYELLTNGIRTVLAAMTSELVLFEEVK